MALRKIVSPKTEKASWQIDYLDPNKKRIRVTFKTRKEANDELAKRVSELG
jgi:Uri superfamily endonuclease